MDYETEIQSPKARYWNLRRLLSGEGYEGDSLAIVPDGELGSGWYKPKDDTSLLINGESSIELRLDMFRTKQFYDITMDAMFLQNIIYISKISMKDCDEYIIELIKEYLK